MGSTRVNLRAGDSHVVTSLIKLSVAHRVLYDDGVRL